MKSFKTKVQIYQEMVSLFTETATLVPESIINDYLSDDKTPLTNYINDNIRGDIHDWITTDGVLEAIDLLFKKSYESSRLSNELL